MLTHQFPPFAFQSRPLYFSLSHDRLLFFSFQTQDPENSLIASSDSYQLEPQITKSKNLIRIRKFVITTVGTFIMDDVLSLQNIFAGLMPPDSDLSEALSTLAFQPISLRARTTETHQRNWIFDFPTPLSPDNALRTLPPEATGPSDLHAFRKKRKHRHKPKHDENNNPAPTIPQLTHLERGARPDKQPGETWHEARARWRIERPLFGGLTGGEVELKDYYLAKVEGGEGLRDDQRNALQRYVKEQITYRCKELWKDEWSKMGEEEVMRDEVVRGLSELIMRVNKLPVVEGGKVVGGEGRKRIRQRARHRGGKDDKSAVQYEIADKNALEETADGVGPESQK
ncbi:hypothetical protein GLAREA_03521 [Glarea lozoyensis ATCC 20868]|uniref:Uncharacterized protein n=1 Tax=Glarea lozoyensis (strain ATCC 20868 / MF5171) TaxID=1116229 RepID=S3D068_GLAL2|nr:uncharacterized protein GLAREA_03521 [Glarea lozoyensis ATCC 20868]EPE30554.1 hypothetical protein GLAREA_03521 [Glarea lozoyensis ATCC 20868]